MDLRCGNWLEKNRPSHFCKQFSRACDEGAGCCSGNDLSVQSVLLGQTSAA